MEQGKLQQENRKRRRRFQLVFAGLFVALFVMVLVNICGGSVDISMAEIFRILRREQLEGTEAAIIWKIRLPRICMGAILGGGLALSGLLLQTFFRNPIAGPFVLGISSGAKLAVALTMIIVLGHAGHVSSFALILTAFAGALLSMSIVLAVSQKIKQMSALLVAGIMISYICSAITELMITFAEESDIVNLHSWSQGSFSGMNWEHVKLAGAVVGITAILVFFLAKPMEVFGLGEDYAASLGVNVKRFRFLLILLASLLAAAVTAFAGPISFVGIAVPFLMKKFLHTSKPLIVIPAVFLGGAVFCLFSDLMARILFAPTELNISTVTSILGAPVVIGMLLRRQR